MKEWERKRQLAHYKSFKLNYLEQQLQIMNDNITAIQQRKELLEQAIQEKRGERND